MKIAKALASVSLLFLMSTQVAAAEDQKMGFFVTSVGIGQGANLGGLEGADAHCTALAEAAGSEGRTWRAYLSTQVTEGRGISARDRIGLGPWYNARGELIAVDLDQLHISPNIVKRTALDENGNLVNGRGDKPNEHDILTGTRDDGTAYFPGRRAIIPVATGQTPARAAPRSGTMTGMAVARRPGIRRMARAGAVRRTCKAAAARVVFIVLPRIDPGSRLKAIVA